MATRYNGQAEKSGEIIDNFKDVYKYYKRRDKPLNVTGVTDFSNLTKESLSEVEDFPLACPEGLKQFPGLKPVSEWKAYQLRNKPGFVVIRNPFEAEYQRYWVERCLVDFPVKPNTTNVDAHMERPSHIWETCHTSEGPDLRKDSLLMKLRWATLGYQYEWNTKEYFSDRQKGFPNDLAYLCNYIAEAMGYKDFSSEAGIVNYYRMESTLMGHTDVSELDKAAPLISFSFGQDCIFLIGGPTKATKPVPLFLHSGDISLMTGPARLSYHAVPRILQADPDYIKACFCNSSYKTAVTTNGLAADLKNNCDKKFSVNAHEQSDSEARTENNSKNHYISKENSCAVGTNDTNKAPSDQELEEDDPYTSSASQSTTSKVMYESCDSKVDDFIDQYASLSSEGKSCELVNLKKLMDRVIKETDWTPFEKYLNQSRINVNVRKVLVEGETLPLSPEIIPKCQRNK